MRRVRVPLIAVLLPLALVAASGCGVTADTTAATVGQETVSVDTVNELARSAPFSSAPGAGEDNESVLVGDVARSALGFAVQKAAAVSIAKSFGMTLDDAQRAKGADLLDSELEKATTQGQSVPEFSGPTRAAYVDLFASYQFIQDHFGGGEPSAKDLRTVYDLYANQPDFWNFTCLEAVAAPAEQQAAVEAELADGASFEQILDEVDGSQMLLDADAGCQSTKSLSPQLTEALAAVEPGEPTAALSTSDPTTGATLVAYVRLLSSSYLSFDDAQAELPKVVATLAQDPSAAIGILASTAEVNPRYGSSVEIDTQGQIQVLAPPAPAGSGLDRTPSFVTGADTGQ